MTVGTETREVISSYKRGEHKCQQVVYKTYLGSVGGKSRWHSKTRHERVGRA